MKDVITPFNISGVDVTANQEDISDYETFQLEFEPKTKRWYVRTMQDRYFTLQPGGGIQANEHQKYVIHLPFFAVVARKWCSLSHNFL